MQLKSTKNTTEASALEDILYKACVDSPNDVGVGLLLNRAKKSAGTNEEAVHVSQLMLACQRHGSDLSIRVIFDLARANNNDDEKKRWMEVGVELMQILKKAVDVKGTNDTFLQLPLHMHEE